MRDAIRREFGIDNGDPVILFCAKFIEKKQPLLLLEAFDKVRRGRSCWLLMVGSGELQEAAKRFVAERRIPNVIMPGFMNQAEISRAYVCSDIFVLPSAFQETWGLAVNEAMNFNLPVVVSDRVGCGEDLVRHGWNGFVFAYDKVEALAEGLGTLADSESLRREFGARSGSVVTGHSIEACADGIVEGCLAAVSEREGLRRMRRRPVREAISSLFAL